MLDNVYVFKDESGEWRWHRKSSNGRILSDSGEGYKNRQDAIDMAARSNGAALLWVDGKPLYQLINVPEHLRKGNNVEQEKDQDSQD